MLFTRQAYEACGGHEAVKDQVLEDVGLARGVKRAGHRSVLADAGRSVHTRMYRSARDVWEGYSKNAFAFFGYSPFFLSVGLAVLAALYVLPVGFAVYGALSGNHEVLYLALAQYAGAVVGRALLAARFGYRVVDALLHPVAVSYIMAIAVNSMRWALTGRGAWKGRPATVAGRARGGGSVEEKLAPGGEPEGEENHNQGIAGQDGNR
jgi:chlorobactene glucosyltransferase